MLVGDAFFGQEIGASLKECNQSICNLLNLSFHKDEFKATRSDPSPPVARLHRFFISICNSVVNDAEIYTHRTRKTNLLEVLFTLDRIFQLDLKLHNALLGDLSFGSQHEYLIFKSQKMQQKG